MKLPSKIAAGSAVAALVLGLASPALATNAGTKNGNHTSGCGVAWQASATLNTGLKNNDAEYPNLMVNLAGDEVGYPNGGYIESVSPALPNANGKKSPGAMEVNHFYGELTQPAWRYVLVSDHTMKNAKMTIKLPADMPAESWTYKPTDQHLADYMRTTAGGEFKDYTFATKDMTSDIKQDGDKTYTFTIGEIPAMTGVVIVFDGKLTKGTPTDRNYVASANLSAEYEPGVEDCTAPVPTTGNPSPSQSGEPTPTESGNPTPTESGTATPSATGTPTSTPSASTTSAPAPGTDRPSSDNPRPGDNGDDGDDDNGGKLPRTGSDAVAPLLAAGGALLLVGAAVLLFVRRRRS